MGKKNTTTHIVRYSSKAIKTLKGETDWKRLKKMKDKDIDTSDIPELSKAFWKNVQLLNPHPKHLVSLRVDDDVIDFFKAQGKGYQVRMNAVLRAYVEASKPAH